MGVLIEALRADVAAGSPSSASLLREHDTEIAALTARAERAEAELEAQHARVTVFGRERDRLAAELEAIRDAGGGPNYALERKRCAEMAAILAPHRPAWQLPQGPWTWRDVRVSVAALVNSMRSIREHAAGLQRGSVREAIGVLSEDELTLDAARRLRADRDRLAADLAAIRGAGGVLTLDECAGVMSARKGRDVQTGSPAALDAQAGARAQHARDVARVRAVVEHKKRADIEDDDAHPGLWMETAGAAACLAAITSDAAPVAEARACGECVQYQAAVAVFARALESDAAVVSADQWLRDHRDTVLSVSTIRYILRAAAAAVLGSEVVAHRPDPEPAAVDWREPPKPAPAPLPPCPVDAATLAEWRGWTGDVRTTLAWLVDAELARRGGR
jgi:hypothetical protein